MQGAYQSAIDSYLSIKPSDSPNTRKLAEAWSAAARLAATHAPPRAQATAAAAARKLLAINDPRAAAPLFVEAGDMAAAVRALCSVGAVQEARKVAAGDPGLEQLVIQLAASSADGGGGIGGGSGGARELEDHARRGNWSQVLRLLLSNEATYICCSWKVDQQHSTCRAKAQDILYVLPAYPACVYRLRCQCTVRHTHDCNAVQVHKLAAAQGSDTAVEYALKHARHLASRQLWPDAARALRDNPPPAVAQNVPLFLDIALGVLHLQKAAEDADAESALASALLGITTRLAVCACIACLHQ